MRKKAFYGWYVVGAGILVLGMAMGVVGNCMSIFIVPICAETGFLRAEIGFTQTIVSLGGMLVAFTAGGLYRKIKLKRLMEIGGVLLCVSYFLFSRARSLPAFYLCAALCALCAAVCATVPFAIIINNWFHRRAGFALGLVFMGSGIFGMLFSFLGGRLIDFIGWRNTIACFSAVMAVTALPCIFFVVKVRPEEMGLMAYGETEDTRADASPGTGVAFLEAIRSARFIIILGSLFFLGMGINGFNCTLTPHLIDSGYSGATAASVNSVYLAMLALGKVALGWLSDRIGAKRACLSAVLCLVLCEACLIFCAYGPALIILLLTSGLGIASSTVLIPVITHACFGSRDFAAVNGLCVASCSAGCAVAPTLLGFVFDRTGGYAPGYWAFLIAAVVCGALLVLAVPTKARQYGGNTEPSARG